MVAFTDGHDTSSDQFPGDAAGAGAELEDVTQVQRFYALSFEGDDVVPDDLRSLLAVPWDSTARDLLSSFDNRPSEQV